LTEHEGEEEKKEKKEKNEKEEEEEYKEKPKYPNQRFGFFCVVYLEALNMAVTVSNFPLMLCNMKFEIGICLRGKNKFLLIGAV